MFYNLRDPQRPVNNRPQVPKTIAVAVFVHALVDMSGAAPGRCADCGSDAYIQLAVGDQMLCAHCYQDRLGLTKKAARKGSERETRPPQARAI